MRERLLGVETEYGLALFDARGGAVESGRGALGLVEAARQRYAHLSDVHSGGIYLSNAGRLYVDVGWHPEFSTPECTAPADVVRFVKAGHRLVAESAAALASEWRPRVSPVAFLANVDPRTHQTWGTHDSIMHAADVARLPEQLIPHLVSRVIYTGAGGFNARAPGIHFTLSPRVWHLQRVISYNSTELRGIFHTKNEPLAGDGSNRLHILCGESVWSDASLWLRIATTALIVAVIEAGYAPGGPVQLHAPLDAMRRYASDPSCRAVAPGPRGLPLSALAVQRHYLAAVESQLRRRFMPAWAAEACGRWRDVLDRLEQGPPAVATTLDWAIKLTVFAERAARHGIAWDTVPAWNHVAADLSRALQALDGKPVALAPGLIAERRVPLAAEIARLTPFMRAHGLDWDAFDTFLALRDELFELDLRFGQLDERGIFAALDRAGVLAHAVPGVDDASVLDAMYNPPSGGRAHLRGTMVRRLAAQPGLYRCSWDAIWDQGANRHLDLSNPFATSAEWRPR